MQRHLAEEINEEHFEKKERLLRRIFIYCSVFCIILMIIVIPISFYLVKIIQNPDNSTTVISDTTSIKNPNLKIKVRNNEVINHFTNFSSSSTKYSNCLIPNFQNAESETSSPS